MRILWQTSRFDVAHFWMNGAHHGQNDERCDHRGGKEKKIELFMPDLRRKQQILKENGVETGEQWLIKLHLAHEFYHFLEFINAGKSVCARSVQKKDDFWYGAKTAYNSQRDRRTQFCGKIYEE